MIAVRLLLTGLALLFLSQPMPAAAQAPVVEEVVTIPVTLNHPEMGEVRHPMVVTVFRDPAASARSPFLVLLHGRATTAEDRARFGRARYGANSAYFVGLGFVVLVPTRIGYGVTGGPDLEDSGACGTKRYGPGYQAAADQALAVAAFARRRPEVDPARGLVVGQSFGGMTAVAVAARGDAAQLGLRAAVNFAGGGGGRPETAPWLPCGPVELRELFASYGRAARLPSLWLYAENDRFFGPHLPRSWFSAYATNPAVPARFVPLPAISGDGHASFTRNPDAWRTPVETFLREAGLR